MFSSPLLPPNLKVRLKVRVNCEFACGRQLQWNADCIYHKSTKWQCNSTLLWVLGRKCRRIPFMKAQEDTLTGKN